ncbi:MAG: hypothetical protein EXQ49_09160 [Acidobacteria bacterium]|nr:hypothetical protein [Acidobacteriota bacterium]
MTGAHSLERIADHSRSIQGVWACDIKPGDWVVVRTRNSVYSLAALGDGRFQVAGGWFAAEGLESTPVRVVGCTWGRRAILTDLVAAPGMFIEFSNGVHTTRVRNVRVLRGGGTTTAH